MALPVMTFTDPRLSQPIKQAPWLTGMQTGMGLAGQLQKMQEEAKMAPLKQQYVAGQVATQPYQQQLLQAQAQQAMANALKARALAKSPFGGKILPGAAGRSQGMKVLTDMLGKNSPYVQNAWKDYQADMKLKLGRAQYYTANTILKNVPLVNKMQIMENYQNEQAARTKAGGKPQTFKEWYQQPANQAGIAPSMTSNLAPSAQGSNVPVTSTTPTAPEQAIAGTQQTPAVPAQPAGQVPTALRPAMQPQATAQAGLAQEPFGMEAAQTGVGISTKTIAPFVQQKIPYAKNIQKTLAQMPEQAITSYSQNPAKLANDYRKSLLGTNTASYNNYLKFLTNAKFLSQQVRQFYGDSIDPAMTKRLDEMTNPISWRTSPKSALVKYNAVKNTLGREINTYIDEATDPKFFMKMKESKVLKGQTPFGTVPAKKQGVAPTIKSTALTSPGMLKGSDGRLYSRAELLKISRGGR